MPTPCPLLELPLAGRAGEAICVRDVKEAAVIEKETALKNGYKFEKYSYCQLCLSSFAPQLWNNLPAKLMSSPSLDNFKKQLKSHKLFCTDFMFMLRFQLL